MWFQSPWIRFVLGQYRIVPEEIEFQSPWIRFAHDFLREVADAVDNEFQSPWIRFAQPYYVEVEG